MKKQLQFELWQECNNRCKFCYLGKGNRYTPDHIKLNSLKSTYEMISDLSIYDEFDTIGYLGGEFFQGQLNTSEIKENFFKLMQKSAWLLKNKYVKSVWIYATMTIGDQKDLYDTLKLFGDCDGVWLLTSYDTYGRFHTKEAEQNWRYHMKNIQNLYPKIKFNVTTILSQDLILKYLRNEISFKDMMKEFKCTFFFKQCGLFDGLKKEQSLDKLPLFLPKRADFLKFLNKMYDEESADMWDRLFNIKYRADALYRNFNSSDQSMVLNLRYKDRKSEVDVPSNPSAEEMLMSPCGHAESYAAYADSDGCVLCDKESVEQMKSME